MVRKRKALLSSLLVLMLLSTFFAAPAFAATKSLKSYGASTTRTASKLPKVKTGTTTLKVKASGSTSPRWTAVRFVAPKTKTYTFSVYGLKNSKYRVLLGYANLAQYKNRTWQDRYLKTNGGKSTYFRFSSKATSKLSTNKQYKLVDRYLYKRTFKAKLKKGETNCIRFVVGGSNDGNVLYPKYTVSLNIK